MKEESLLGKGGTRSSASPARYRQLGGLGEASRQYSIYSIYFIYFFVGWFAPRAAEMLFPGALTKSRVCWPLLTPEEFPKPTLSARNCFLLAVTMISSPLPFSHSFCCAGFPGWAVPSLALGALVALRVLLAELWAFLSCFSCPLSGVCALSGEMEPRRGAETPRIIQRFDLNYLESLAKALLMRRKRVFTV